MCVASTCATPVTGFRSRRCRGFSSRSTRRRKSAKVPGLGLAIAYGIVQEHGGQIAAAESSGGWRGFHGRTTKQATGMIDETFLTTEEVLEYLQVNLRTVYRLIKAGQDSGGPRGPSVAISQDRHRRVARQSAPTGADRRTPAPTPARRSRRSADVRACSSSTTRPASGTCWRRRWRSPNTTSTSRLTADRRSNGCGCIRTICSLRT